MLPARSRPAGGFRSGCDRAVAPARCAPHRPAAHGAAQQPEPEGGRGAEGSSPNGDPPPPFVFVVRDGLGGSRRLRRARQPGYVSAVGGAFLVGVRRPPRTGCAEQQRTPRPGYLDRVGGQATRRQARGERVEGLGHVVPGLLQISFDPGGVAAGEVGADLNQFALDYGRHRADRGPIMHVPGGFPLGGSGSAAAEQAASKPRYLLLRRLLRFSRTVTIQPDPVQRGPSVGCAVSVTLVADICHDRRPSHWPTAPTAARPQATLETTVADGNRRWQAGVSASVRRRHGQAYPPGHDGVRRCGKPGKREAAPVPLRQTEQPVLLPGDG